VNREIYWSINQTYLLERMLQWEPRWLEVWLVNREVRCKSDAAPATVIDDECSMCHWETGKADNSDESRARRPACRFVKWNL